MSASERFVHLHVHSEYSLLDGAARIRDLTARAAELGMRSLALTDHGVMYGAVPFYKSCLQHGIRPIIGCEVYITGGSRLDKGSRRDNPNYHLILLAKNETGYRNLMKLSTIGHLEGFHYKPRIDHEVLALHSEGLVCLSSCLSGEVSQHLLHDRTEEARQAALRYRDIFGEDFFLEIQDHGMAEQKKVIAGMLSLSEETGIPLAATNDTHYLRQEDAAVQDVLISIGTGKSVSDPDRMRMHGDQMYLKDAEEMERLFRYASQALENTAIIAERCNLELRFGEHALPEYYPLPEGMGAAAYLEQLCLQGLEKRYGGEAGTGTKGQAEAREFMRTAEQRLRYELSVIERMGFSDYFLIVWDFIRYAHEQGIRTGPGRGSSAGSLVAYSLRITDVDPLKHKLLFERFLNPERISMPDIDIDFNDERRDEVIAYVSRKYGAGHVAQIITFGTLAAKAAVRDVGRALDVPLSDVDRVAKLIPGQPGTTLESAIRSVPQLKESSEHPATRDLIAMALKVEGMPRHASTHAAGVVIAGQPLTNYVPLQAGSEAAPLTQYSMEHVEAVGLLKMDFLGLRTLSILERTLEWIRTAEGISIDFHHIPDDDPQTYEMLGRGDTTGIFQLESSGVRRVLRDLKPSAFEDIISVLALYRPGPMEFIPRFIAGKHGLAEVEYPHPSLEPILKDTYGIIVYQEQIMQIASEMAGFTLGEADLLRRAVSKKKREILDEQRAAFVRGSLGLGYSEEEADRVYDMILRFADYGFPRAHAAAYGVLAFQTAWLKRHYPVAFMASMLAAVTGHQRKTGEYIDECKRMGISVLPPDVNHSGITFTPDGSALRFGLASIKNVGTQAIESIMRERENRPFGSLIDLCRRVDLRVVNKRVLESLIGAGALDSLPGHRAQLLAALDESVETAQKWRKEREELQIELFGLEEVQNWDVELPSVPPYTTVHQLELEHGLLGLYLSGHPLDSAGERLDRLELDRLVDLADAPDGSSGVAAVRVVSLKQLRTRKGQQMAFAEVEDRILRVEAVLFPAVWSRLADKLQPGSLVILQVAVQQGDEDFKLIVDDLVSLEAGDADLANGVQRLQRQARGRSSRAGAAVRAGAATPAAVSAQSKAPAPRGAAVSGQSSVPAIRGAATPAHGSTDVLDGTAGVEPLTAADRSRAAAVGSQEHPRRADAPNRAFGERLPDSSSAPVALPAPAAGRRSTPASAREQQRVYIKIRADREHPAALERLKELLAEHAGPLGTVLFYEREARTIALSERYRVRPSPELIEQIEDLLGKGAAVVK